MISSPSEVSALVEREIATVKDPLVAGAIRKSLVAPEPHMRAWDYGAPGEQFRCWPVAKEENGDAGIVYCEQGFGPECPWGLVWLSDARIGMDCSWFPSLAEAFLDSFLAVDLRIWSVVEQPDVGEERIIASGLTHGDAFVRRDELGDQWDGGRREVAYRPEPSGNT